MRITLQTRCDRTEANLPFLPGQIFSALYSMLPTSKKYFVQSGYSHQMAGLMMIVWLVVGFLGIQIVSRLVHRFFPSRVVDCDHNHKGAHLGHHSPSPSRHASPSRALLKCRPVEVPSTIPETANGNAVASASESTPLLVREHHEHPMDSSDHQHTASPGLEITDRTSVVRGPSRSYTTAGYETTSSRRPPMVQVQERVLSFVKDLRNNCDETGPCYGYSDPCGQECFKHINQTSSTGARRVSLLRTPTGALYPSNQRPGFARGRDVESRDPSLISGTERALSSPPPGSPGDNSDEAAERASINSSEDIESQHHHHVPTNAFLSIGLQTSIAIALHKFPEGFITYATNHANPSLGFNVFMALFVHNISEGFTIALPLYMALKSRVKALLWAFLLGGLSQPLGAAAAALWFRLTRDREVFSPNNVVYAGLFAGTAGIMVSVALQLFVESLSLGHDRNLSIFCAFLGMVILGVSGALVVDDH